MLVACSKCSSKYQLSDDKIKSTGTKVRCPRCQNTFRVYPPPPAEEEHSEEEDHTEFFKRSEKSVRPTQAPKPKVKETNNDAIFSKYNRENPEPLVQKSKLALEEPFKAPPAPTPPIDEEATARAKPATLGSISRRKVEEKSISEEESFLSDSADSASDEVSQDAFGFGTKQAEVSAQDSLDEEATSHESQKIKEEEKPLPFGDATFFALQHMAKPNNRSKKMAIGAVVVILLTAAYFTFTNVPQRQNFSKENISTPTNANRVVILRPANWYRADPNVYQDFLTQMASKPSAEQKKPENRAAIAEALILNGILNGADDQIASGLGFSSGLIASLPNDVYGFYGLSTYALWNDDYQTVSDLAARWPVGNRADQEYQLAKLVADSRIQDAKKTMETAKKLLTETQDYHLAMMATLNLYLESPEEAQRILGERYSQELLKAYQKHRASMQNTNRMPNLYKVIDKKLARKGLTADGEKKEAAKPPSPTATIVNKPAAAAPAHVAETTKALNEKAAKKLKEKKDSKHLPKASQQLIAQNKMINRERSDAEKVYDQALSLQQQNRDDEAMVLYQKSLRLNPDLADSYRQLGRIYMSKQDKERALRSLKIYLQLKPQSEDKQLVEGWISSLQ